MKKFILTAMVIVAIATVTVNAGVLFSEDFSGGTGDIDGTTPDVTTGGATWVAGSVFNADGSVEQGAGSMTLAFTPLNGQVYTLDASVSGVSAPVNDFDWLALGFADGQSSASTTSSRFVNGSTPLGVAWMLFRGYIDSPHPNKTHTDGSNNPVTWTSLTDLTDSVDMRIVLDTTAGTGTWAATWYAKAPVDSSYSEVGATMVLTNQTISSVGMALSGLGVTGTVESFSLTVVPEPATLALLGLGGLVLRRRRNG